jgi:hypothetical protein
MVSLKAALYLTISGKLMHIHDSVIATCKELGIAVVAYS